MLVLPVVANQSAAGLHACVYGKENVYALAFYVGDRDQAAVIKELKALGQAFVESARPKTRVGELLAAEGVDLDEEILSLAARKLTLRDSNAPGLQVESRRVQKASALY